MELNPNAVGFCWFTGRSCICIAIWYSEERGEIRAGINTVPGHDQEADINFTIDWGSEFPVQEAISLIDKYGGWVKPEKENWIPKPESDSPFRLKLKYKNESEKRKQVAESKNVAIYDYSGSLKEQFDPNILL